MVATTLRTTVTLMRVLARSRISMTCWVLVTRQIFESSWTSSPTTAQVNIHGFKRRWQVRQTPHRGSVSTAYAGAVMPGNCHQTIGNPCFLVRLGLPLSRAMVPQAVGGICTCLIALSLTSIGKMRKSARSLRTSSVCGSTVVWMVCGLMSQPASSKPRTTPNQMTHGRIPIGTKMVFTRFIAIGGQCAMSSTIECSSPKQFLGFRTDLLAISVLMNCIWPSTSVNCKARGMRRHFASRSYGRCTTTTPWVRPPHGFWKTTTLRGLFPATAVHHFCNLVNHRPSWTMSQHMS